VSLNEVVRTSPENSSVSLTVIMYSPVCVGSLVEISKLACPGVIVTNGGAKTKLNTKDVSAFGGTTEYKGSGTTSYVELIW